MKKKLKNISIFISFVLILIFFVSIFTKDYLGSFITHNIQIYGIIFIILITAFLEIVPQFIAPHLILINLQIIGFSTFFSVLAVIIGALTGALFGFYLGKRYGIDFVNSIYSKKEIRSLNEKIDKYGKWIILIAALSPVPYIPVIFGSVDMDWKTFIIFGIIPRMLGILITGLFFI